MSACAAIGCDRQAYKTTTLCPRCGELPGPLGVPVRIWSQIQYAPSGCWIWTGYTLRNGYGQVRVNGRRWLLHRYLYESARGQIGDGLTIDHLCRNKCCVNPDHLEAVDSRSNIVRAVAARPGQSSRFIGVFRHRGAVLWTSSVRSRRVVLWCERFESEVDAARAYDEQAVRHIGPESDTNASLGLFDDRAA